MQVTSETASLGLPAPAPYKTLVGSRKCDSSGPRCIAFLSTLRFEFLSVRHSAGTRWLLGEQDILTQAPQGITECQAGGEMRVPWMGGAGAEEPASQRKGLVCSCSMCRSRLRIGPGAVWLCRE